ncbi:MAG: transporter [Limisphaerales bacterium]
MKLQSTYLSICAALLALPLVCHAQPSAHYCPGLEGIKGASMPPPGIYLRDNNIAYYSDQLNDPKGNAIGGLNTRAFVYANVPRLIWISDYQLLGGYLGLEGTVPVKYTSLRLGSFDDRTFGVGDAFVTSNWSRHWKQLDLVLGYGVWAPTGDSSTGPGENPTRAGLGYWTHMFTAGAAWYPDAAKKWSVSALSRYEINMEHDDYTVGQAYTLEWGLGRTILQNIDAGLAGYYQQKVTSDTGGPPRDRVAGIGPEISTSWPKYALGVSLRYAYEFMAEGGTATPADGRLEGHTVTLTVTKRF